MRIATLKAPGLLWLVILVTVVVPCRAQDALPLRLSIVTPWHSKLIVWVAQNEGLYRKNGLDVEIYTPPNAADNFKQVTGIQVPAQYVRQTPLSPVTIGGGTPGIVRIGANPGARKTRIITSADNIANWAILARQDITRPEQLQGKRLGHSDNISHFHALLFLKTMGWVRNRDISLVPDVEHLEPLLNGSVDALIANDIVTFMARRRGYRPLVDMGEWKVPMTISGITADEDWLQANRETMRRLVKSYVEAIALMKQDKQVAVRAMVKFWNVTDPQLQDWFYERGVVLVPQKPYPNVAGIRKAMELYDSPEMRKHVPEDFYDDSFVRELDRSGHIDSLY
jgi:ABC-type nitrate/sulfonate/bicarbonate transport system substrate-binding protein